ncbi:MAG: Hsp20/alpha crystallin family protein [Fimbriimonadaceae bacterium]|nr:Hsp20/alpha crystallin family protein [Fimbriimonadaceae bacterium]
MARQNRDEWLWQVIPGQLILSQPGVTVSRSIRSKGIWQPSIDLYETPKLFVLKAEIAGVEPDQVQILYVPGQHSVLIRGAREEADPSEEVRTSIHQLEVYYGEFEREVPLPQCPVEPEQMRAQFRNGILYIEIPKARVRVNHTRITIRKV